MVEIQWPAHLGQQENTAQDAQKGSPARPQQAKRRRRTLRYVELLSEARTPLADFFSILRRLVVESLINKSLSSSEARMSRRTQTQLQQTYREQALKMFPWICANCGREFEGKKLSQLTVHHKDHNHDNNPPDGSNWELLCLYCHDNEHQRNQVADASGEAPPGRKPEQPSTFTPFAHLADLIKRNT
jgi:hypothetical protein